MKKRGHPQRHPIDTLRTKVWFAQASERLGGKTAYWFWANIDNKVGSLSKWNKYRTGDRVPSNKKGHGSVNLLAKKWPGTDTIFYGLFWFILKHGHAEAEAINKELSTLGGQFSILPKIILEGGFADNVDSSGLFPFEDMLDQLANQCDSDFHTLQAIVLLLALANNGHPDHWNAFCDLYRQMLPDLMLEVDVPFKVDVFDQVDAFAIRRDLRIFNDPKYHDPKYIDISWRDEIPRFQSTLSKNYFECFKVQRKYLSFPRDLFSDEVCHFLAVEIAHRICEDEYLMMNSRELWKPICWELAKLSHGHFKDIKIFGNNFWTHLEEEIRYFLDPTTRLKNYEDNFSITFQG